MGAKNKPQEHALEAERLMKQAEHAYAESGPYDPDPRHKWLQRQAQVNATLAVAAELRLLRLEGESE